MVVPTILGVPVGVKPAAPHSISQTVAVPFSVHPKSAVVAVILVAVKAVGASHTCSVIATESINIPSVLLVLIIETINSTVSTPAAMVNCCVTLTKLPADDRCSES